MQRFHCKFSILIGFIATLLLTGNLGLAYAQTITHWLGKSTGAEYVFTTPIPADVAGMITANDPKYTRFRDFSKVSTEVIDGKNYSVVSISVAWDNDMIDGGRIAFSRDNGVEPGSFFTMDTKSLQWKALSDELKAQATHQKTWKFVNLKVLQETSDTPPSVRLAIPEMTQIRTKLASFNDGPTKPGQFYPEVKVPADLDQVRALMSAYGNAGRRDPDFRLKNGSKTVTSLAPDTVATLKSAAEKVNKDNSVPPYFRDLVLDAKLNDAAQFQAEYQASINNMTHDGPRQYRVPNSRDRINMFDLSDRSKHFANITNVVEACGYGSVSDYPHSWMTSDTHFRPWFNVDKFYPAIGYGAAKSPSGNWYFTAVVSFEDTPAKSVTAAPSDVAVPAPQPAPIANLDPTRFPLAAGTTIVQGTKYRSESGKHYLVFQPDGNVVLYSEDGQHAWSLDMVAAKYAESKSVTLQTDGNFVVLGQDEAFIWSALAENPDKSAYLTLTPEGVLQLVSRDTGATLWSSR